MEFMVIVVIAIVITFYVYSNLSVYRTLYYKIQEENHIVELSKNKLEKLYNRQYKSYLAVSASKDNLSEELETSIKQYKNTKKQVEILEKEKQMLETKIDQLYDTIGNN